MENKFDLNIPKEKFAFANDAKNLHDKELVTKPISYFKDAWLRFKKNKGSIVASIIIAILFLYAIVVPFFSPYTVSYSDKNFSFTLPKVSLLENTNFLDGCAKKTVNEQTFLYYYAMGYETGHNAVKNQEYTSYIAELPNGGTSKMFTYRQDSYTQKGCVYIDDLDFEAYSKLQDYQNRTGIQVIYPMVNTSDSYMKNHIAVQDRADSANFWYYSTIKEGKTILDPSAYVINEDGSYTITKTNYKTFTGNRTDDYTSNIIEGTENCLYATRTVSDKIYDEGGNVIQKIYSYRVRVNYYEYYIYYHQEVLHDHIKKPNFIFGTTNFGQDIFTCLASGARFSFALAIVVAIVNLVVGAIYGAVEGYYGGKIDLIMERFVEILSAVPFMIVITLLKYHMRENSQIVVLFIAFFLTGWIGMASTTRMQFYRFKNQEYVLASRTLGAKDWRIMFKHIFPNSLGTLVTSCVLVIPGMIFSETSLSYLGIINLSSGNLTSVGTLLAAGQPYFTEYPHMIFYPSVFISLLMLSFNLFGNGLRDAFNPSLRGTED